jgi:opacity protein-like surface antigen
MKGNRISVSADIGGTFQITNKLRVSDRFRFYNFRTPAQWNATTSTWLGTSALTPVGPTPDSVDNTIFAWFLGENTKSNEIDVEYDFSKHLGGNLGYRFRQMIYHHTDNTNEVTTGDVSSAEDFVDVNSHTALLGVWFRPSDKLRANFDAELTTADNFLTRISPRRLQQYRARARYQPVRWITLSATGNIYEARNGIQEISYNAHTRNFGFTATANRNERFGVELAYNYNNVGSNAFICFQDTASPIPGNPGACAADPEGGAPFELYQVYSNRNHFGTGTLLLKPVKRLTTNVGYSIVSSDGNFTIINPLQPYGSLRSNFHRPFADFEFEVAKGWSAVAKWNYYDYGEKNPFFGPTYPRDFHANVTTLALRYSF